MKKFYLLSILAIGILASSCTTQNYSIRLSAVESPADAKQQFGTTKIVTFDEKGINKYRYEDDYIDIIWYIGRTEFNFTLKNKSNHTLKINWDDISYVDINGQVGRVMHSGVKYTDRNNSQPATTVPKNASISDILLPTANVYFDDVIYKSWQINPLVPKQLFNSNAPSPIGKTMIIMMPIVIEGIQNDYTFTFQFSPK
ncbi:MAG: hypothetical protein J5773_02400 [Verrucomicrobia bacterium]|nr:hypothetical protein [Verrucomicrobiota bacterium]